MNDEPTIGRTRATTREDIARMHEFEHWPGLWLGSPIVASLSLGAAAGVAAANCWELLIVIWPAIGVIDFILVLAFHDASHGRLHPMHRINDAYGHFMGTIMVTPLSVY